MNYPGELFPPTPMNFMDSSLLTFQQRLQELVERRDRKMTEKIDSLLRENSPNKRYFIAVGFSKTIIFFISIELNEFVFCFLFSSFNGFRWYCNEIETRLSIFSHSSM